MIRVIRKRSELTRVPEIGEEFSVSFDEATTGSLLVQNIFFHKSRDGTELVIIHGFG